MNIIIIQLARLGDIIQTLPTIQGLKKSHPDCKITLIVRKTFADAARISPHVDKLIEMPTAEILGPVLSDANQKAESLARLIRWIGDEIAGEKYDLLLNLTFSPASSYLASIIDARERRGLFVSKAQGAYNYAIADSWSQYFFAQVVEQNMNILHLNDLFMRIGGVTADGWPLDIKEPLDCPVPPKGKKTRIGIQISASTFEKTLNPRLWAHLCNVVLGSFEDVELVFFGSNADIPYISQVIEEMRKEAQYVDGRHRVVAGTCRFHENMPWIRSCEWIIAPDTSIVHLASALGVKVLEIPIGKVRPEETGPYGEGHRVVYPSKADGTQLAVEVCRILKGEKGNTLVAECKTKLIRCSDGSLRNEMQPVNFVQEETSNFFMQAYYLLAEFRCGGRLEELGIPHLGEQAAQGSLDRLVNAYDALCTTRRLSEYGQHYCLKMLENISDRALLMDMMAKIGEIDEMLLKVRTTVPLVKPLIDTWRIAKDVASSPASEIGGLEEILALTEGCYRELGQNIEIIQQLLQSAVDAAQRKAVQNPHAQSEATPKERV